MLVENRKKESTCMCLNFLRTRQLENMFSIRLHLLKKGTNINCASTHYSLLNGKTIKINWIEDTHHNKLDCNYINFANLFNRKTLWFIECSSIVIEMNTIFKMNINIYALHHIGLDPYFLLSFFFATGLVLNRMSLRIGDVVLALFSIYISFP